MNIKTIIKKIFGIGPETNEDYRKRGVKLGENVALVDCNLDYSHGYLIEIGNDVCLSHVTLLSHDASVKWLKDGLDHVKVGRIKIGNNVFVGCNSVILPGTTIGNNVLIGAGSVVKGVVPDNVVMSGNPLKLLCSTDEYMKKNRAKFAEGPVYNTDFSTITKEQINKMNLELADGKIGFDL